MFQTRPSTTVASASLCVMEVQQIDHCHYSVTVNVNDLEGDLCMVSWHQFIFFFSSFCWLSFAIKHIFHLFFHILTWIFLWKWKRIGNIYCLCPCRHIHMLTKSQEMGLNASRQSEEVSLLIDLRSNKSCIKLCGKMLTNWLHTTLSYIHISV